MLYTAKGTVRPTPPFDFSLSLAVIAAAPPLREVVATADGVLTTVVCAGGQPTVLSVFNSGPVDAPRLTYRIVSEHPLGEYATLAALNRFGFFLSLDDDLRFLDQLGRADAHFSRVVRRLHGHHQVKFPTPFEAACWPAIGGLTNASAAAHAHAQLVERLGPRVQLTGEVCTAFPDAVRILAAPLRDLVRLPLSARRRLTVRALATAFARVDPLFLREAPAAEVEHWLRRIDGVGPAAARFVLVHGLGRMEAVRLDDRRLGKAFTAVYGEGPPDLQERIESAARHFGPWRGHWAHYLVTDRLLTTTGSLATRDAAAGATSRVAV
jgi:DNA-3-methyladenine glycosylase II